jgi:inner membrane protein
MFALGHTGFTLLSAYLVERALSRPGARSGILSRHQGNQDAAGHNILNDKSSIQVNIDYRLVLLGSMLPDFIDKPLALWILPDVFSITRTIGHSALLGGVLLLLGGLLILRTKRTGMIMLALAYLGHLVLDRMWSLPEVMWWPCYGWGFPGEDGAGAIKGWLDTLFSSPTTYITEIVGGIILMAMVFSLRRRRWWLRFLHHGSPV